MRLREIYPGIIHVLSPSFREIKQTWIRFEESYENPIYNFKKYKKGFTKEDIKKWWKTTEVGKKIPYWFDAFNIPGYVLKPFFEGKFNPLNYKEAELLRKLQPYYNRRNRFYVIGTLGREALKHESAHGLYYISKEYRKQVNLILSTLDKKVVRKIHRYLHKAQGYGKHVLNDETHSWILDEEKRVLEKSGIKFHEILGVKKELNRLYRRFFRRR